jgi:hypothetical protein
MPALQRCTLRSWFDGKDYLGQFLTAIFEMRPRLSVDVASGNASPKLQNTLVLYPIPKLRAV